MGKDVHVVPDGKQWAVETEGSKRAYRITPTQKEAIEIAKEVAKNQESELSIHGKNGQIRDNISYGNDDYPPKG